MDARIPKRLSESVDLFGRKKFRHAAVAVRVAREFGLIGRIVFDVGQVVQVEPQAVTQKFAVGFLVNQVVDIFCRFLFVVDDDFVFGQQLFAFGNPLYGITRRNDYPD